MAKRKEIFVIQEGEGKSYWHRCGVGFVNKDGSVNLKLDLFPGVSMQLRDVEEKSEGR